MRINVYAEELTTNVEIVEKTADNGSRFVGLRFKLKSPKELHQTPTDDDSSAVTFWVKSSKNGFKLGDELFLVGLLSAAITVLYEKASRAK